GIGASRESAAVAEAPGVSESVVTRVRGDRLKHSRLSFFIGHLISLEFLLLNVSRFAIVVLVAVVIWVGLTIWSETRPKQME
ncbi:MAG: hypothetical protein F6K09_28875, partial [Merismopedia sp. SIO2A8]|nr:hypothetical protein [Merismopedia sp. SIO2A8]